MTEQEIREVIKGCSENSRKHQEYLYKSTYKTMMSIVKKYIDCPYIAEEVLHNGYLTIFQKINKYSFKGSFEGWMKKIMFHAVSNAVRQDKRMNTKDSKGFLYKVEIDDSYGISEASTNMPDNAGYKDLLNLIDSLPEQTSKAFKMFLLGFSHIEIGKQLEISEGTSKWHICEARKKLKVLIA